MPVNPLLWQSIRTLIQRPDHPRLTELLKALDPADRRAVAAAVKAYAREIRGDFGVRVDAPSFTLVGVAVLGDAVATASWVRRFGLTSIEWTDDHHREYSHLNASSHVVELISERDPLWLTRFAGKLAERLSTQQGLDAEIFDLVEIVRRRTSMAPPDSEGYLAQLMYSAWREPHADVLRARIIEDSRFADMVPRLFDNDALGLYLSWSDGAVLHVAGLARDGLIDRLTFLDACVGRLQRPGRPKATSAYLAVHEALTPSLEEIAARKRDYLALLPDTLSTVAGVAQRALQRLDETGDLNADELAEATRSVLSRAEKKLHKAQLSWLTAHVKRDPASTEMLALAASSAFTHPAVDVQRAAATWIVSRAAALSASACADVLSAADALPADLRAALAKAVGLPPETSVADIDRPPTVTLNAPTRHPLTPMSSREELAELLAGLGNDREGMTGPRVEQAIEGLIRYGQDDRDALRTALSPLLRHDWWEWTRAPIDSSYGYCDGVSLFNALAELAAAAIELPAQPDFVKHCGHGASRAHHAVVHRILQLSVGLREGRLHGLVSFPTHVDGAIHPDEFYQRLTAASAHGWEPDEDDIDLALLRLDIAACDVAQLSDRLRSIGSTQALRAANGIDRGAPSTPPMRWAEVQHRQRDFDGRSTRITVLGVEPVRDKREDDYGRVWRELREYSLQDSYNGGHGWAEVPLTWPVLLPHHRDLVAAHTVHYAEVLPVLAEANGPVGRAMHLSFAHALAADRESDRTLATDALLTLAAREQFDGDAVGNVLAELTRRGSVKPMRLLNPLRDAATAGAATQVARMLGVLLGSIISSGSKPPSGFADLVALTAETIELSATPVDIAGLAEFSARRGSSRQLVEARRLNTLLHEL